MRWTEELDAHVDRRVSQGATYALIAGELGLTASAIAGRLDRRRRGGPRSDQARAATAVPLPEHNLGDPRVTQEGCRWVIGDPGGLWQWCGEPIVKGAYCAAHAAKSSHRGDAGG